MPDHIELEDYVTAQIERCVCCGDIIPEGRQVCAWCEEENDPTTKGGKGK